MIIFTVIPLFVVNKNRREQRVLKGLCEILEPNTLSMVISLLVRLHNILRDQSSMDIISPLTHVWPPSIKKLVPLYFSHSTADIVQIFLFIIYLA